ncbi:MAG: branched-chain amino acid ABC transporter permease [Calditrichaeota bacterium]|nr:MAG: branched-chain amino acid ABC transporter permease [Calditrichota bacterium]
MLIFLVGVVALLVIENFSGAINPYYFSILIYIGINISLAVSLNLINGFTGQFSLGHAGFMAIGAYSSAVVTHYFGSELVAIFGNGIFGNSAILVISLTFGGLCAALSGLIVGIPSLRLKGDYLAIVTLGFGEIIRVVILNLDVVGGARGFSATSESIPKLTNFFWTFFFAFTVILFVNNLVKSTYGRAFIAVHDDEIASEAMGINTTRYKVIAFIAGAFFGGIAGGLFSQFLPSIYPQSFTFLKSIEIVVMVILGGMGSIVGSVIAAIILTILPELLRGFSEYRMIIYALLIIVMMLTRPTGLFGGGELDKLLAKFRRKEKLG